MSIFNQFIRPNIALISITLGLRDCPRKKGDRNKIRESPFALMYKST